MQENFTVKPAGIVLQLKGRNEGCCIWIYYSIISSIISVAIVWVGYLSVATSKKEITAKNWVYCMLLPLPMALNRHLVCIFCLLQKFIGSWKHVRKIKPWVKKKRSCFRVRLRIKNKVATWRKSKRPSSFRGGKKTSHSPPQRDQCIFATCSLGAGPPYIAPLLHQNEGIRTSTFCSGQALLLTFLLPSLFNPKEKRGGSEDNWGIFNLRKKIHLRLFYPRSLLYFLPN